jgi:2-keto-3-deoxy-L-fuconate dehydrogenase
MLEISGKRAVITGGASGIGLAVARLFSAQGAEVTVLDLEAEKAQATTASLGMDAVTSISCDVSNPASVASAFTKIPGVDILVSSAGIAHVGSLATTSAGDMDRLYCMRAALEPMLAQKQGVILNMASIAATTGIPDRFAYSMTKGAVLAMTLSTARDFLDQGIRCNCISPARVHTPFVDGFLALNYPGQEAEKMKQLEKAQPIGRMGTPDEVATLALYLCSDAASFITGVNYPLDGGFLNLR